MFIIRNQQHVPINFIINKYLSNYNKNIILFHVTLILFFGIYKLFQEIK